MALIPELINAFVENTKNVYQYTVFQLKHPAFNNIYYCVLLAYLFCFTLEVILPKQRKHGLLSRKGFWLDTFYVFFNGKSWMRWILFFDYISCAAGNNDCFILNTHVY